MNTIPEIRIKQGIPTLYVKEKPFFSLAGEIHNSSAESLNYMEKKVWPNLKDLNLNTLVVPLYWNRIEPVEGDFEFSLLDGLIRQARTQGMHLIFLWFGLWKNAESMYVPDWMKQNTEDYFRAEKITGEKMNTISPFCDKAIEKDAEAFREVMAHIRQVDEEESTVIMMQVENELGLLGSSCDYSPKAREKFVEPLPEELTEAVKEWEDSQPAYDLKQKDADRSRKPHGTWSETFGEDAQEIFMAYYFAKAVEKITAAGREEYPLPCYINTWIKQFPWYPGSYPSGGPVKEMHRIWKLAAPSLFTIAPDIYVPYAAEVMEEYSYEGNPLVIPEIRKDAVTASYAFYAFMGHHAICYSPFGIEELGENLDRIQTPTEEMMEALKLDPLSFDLTGTREALSQIYHLLSEMQPLYLHYRETRQMKSYLQGNESEQGVYFRFAHYNVEIEYFPRTVGCPAAAGVVFELDEHKFLLIGMMSRFRFYPKAGENRNVDFLKIEIGSMRNGVFQPEQEMNGDEKMALRMMNKPACYLVELYKY